MLQGLLEALGIFQSRLKGRSSGNVNDRETKSAAIALATSYFNGARPHLVEILGEREDLREQDQSWQELVRLAHVNSKRRTYLKLIRTLAAMLRELSVQTL